MNFEISDKGFAPVDEPSHWLLGGCGPDDEAAPGGGGGGGGGGSGGGSDGSDEGARRACGGAVRGVPAVAHYRRQLDLLNEQV